MLKKRLIPVLLLKNGLLIRSESFKIHQIIGNPIYEVQRFNEWNVDELIYLDITREGEYSIGRSDHKLQDLADPLTILDSVSKTCFMPLTWGGQIQSISDIHQRISRGADKISVNTAAVKNPELITEAAKKFGSQAIVVSIDVKVDKLRQEVYIHGGQTPTGLDPIKWAREVENRGAGEILLQNIDRDGTGNGYDLDLLNAISSRTTIPIIACSGVGRYKHYVEGIEAGASAVAAANIWHFKELSDRNGKRAMMKAGINVRY